MCSSDLRDRPDSSLLSGEVLVAMRSPLLIVALLLLPIAGTAVLSLRPWDARMTTRIAASLTSAQLVVAIAAAVGYHARGGGSFGLTYRRILASSWGLAFDIGVDGISLFLVVLTALVTTLALLGANQGERTFVRWILLLNVATA